MPIGPLVSGELEPDRSDADEIRGEQVAVAVGVASKLDVGPALDDIEDLLLIDCGLPSDSVRSVAAIAALPSGWTELAEPNAILATAKPATASKRGRTSMNPLPASMIWRRPPPSGKSCDGHRNGAQSVSTGRTRPPRNT